MKRLPSLVLMCCLAVMLPFEQILDVAEYLLPLTLAHMEGTLTIRRDIAEVRLGHMRVQCADEPNKLKLAPVWDSYSVLHRFKDGRPHHTDATACHSWLTINALDGTVIDRSYGY